MSNKPLTPREISKIRAALMKPFSLKIMDRLYQKVLGRPPNINEDTGSWHSVVANAVRRYPHHDMTIWLLTNIKDFSKKVSSQHGVCFYDVIAGSDFDNQGFITEILFRTVTDSAAKGKPYTYDFPEIFRLFQSPDSVQALAEKYAKNHECFREYLKSNPERRALLEESGADLSIWDKQMSPEDFVKKFKVDRNGFQNRSAVGYGMPTPDPSHRQRGVDEAPSIEVYKTENILQTALLASIGSFSARQYFDHAAGQLNASTSRKRRHLMFSGPPGTGKTSLARVLGRHFKEQGMLEKGHVVETTASALTGQYVGHTAPLVRAAVEAAKGGVLFIDEIYHFADGGTNGQGYGSDAVEELLALMENDGDDFILIAAGYKEHNQEFLAMNPGMRDRFGYDFPFDHFSRDQLRKILQINVDRKSPGIEEGSVRLSIEDGAVEVMLDFLENDKEKNPNSYANARTLENWLDAVLDQHAGAVSELMGRVKDFTQASVGDQRKLMTLTCDDAKRACAKLLADRLIVGKREIGFGPAPS